MIDIVVQLFLFSVIVFTLVVTVLFPVEVPLFLSYLHNELLSFIKTNY